MANEDYFSIDDILSAEPRLYATFRVRGHHLGHLDPIGVQAAVQSQPQSSMSQPTTSSASVGTSSGVTGATDTAPSSTGNDVSAEDPTMHVPAKHRLALPFWLAETLAERNIVTLHLPHCFKSPVRHALRADASSVPLHQLCPSYYALGVRVAKLINDVSLPAVLVRAFANRCWPIVDQAAYAAARGSRALTKLDRLERRLFFAMHGVTNAVVRWKERSCDRIGPSKPLKGKRPRSSNQTESEVASPVTPPATSRVRVC